VSYEPREFWEERLREHFDERGTGEPGLSKAYNDACYALRLDVLERALRGAGLDPRGRRVLDVGCGAGFFTAWYLARGAAVTGLDIAPHSIETLRLRFPTARFVLADVSETRLEDRYDLVNAFDVLYHIVDDARWERALGTLAVAVEPGGLLLVTDAFASQGGLEAHNRMRPLAAYARLLEPRGFRLAPLRPTHALLNRELGMVRFLNRAPALLLAADRLLLAAGPLVPRAAAALRLPLNQLLVATRGR
jgi:SAM-dependent methyltransferase